MITIHAAASDCIYVQHGDVNIQILLRNDNLIVIVPDKGTQELDDVNKNHRVFEISGAVLKGVFS